MQLSNCEKKILFFILSFCSFFPRFFLSILRSVSFHDGGPYYIETSLLICPANNWTGFYIIRTSVMKELIHFIPLIFFDTPWKHQKSSGPGLLLFSRCIERDQRHEMGKLSLNTPRNILNTVKEHLITSHLITLCRNFVERHSFRIVSGKSPETMRKLCLSTKLPHQEIRRNCYFTVTVVRS